MCRKGSITAKVFHNKNSQNIYFCPNNTTELWVFKISKDIHQNLMRIMSQDHVFRAIVDIMSWNRIKTETPLTKRHRM